MMIDGDADDAVDGDDDDDDDCDDDDDHDLFLRPFMTLVRERRREGWMRVSHQGEQALSGCSRPHPRGSIARGSEHMPAIARIHY